MDFKKISVVTGGSSGLGLSISKELLKQNKNVCIIGRNIEKLKLAKVELEKINSQAVIETYKLNISDEKAVKNFYLALYKKYDEVDYLFNVAGVGVFGDVKDVTRKNLDDVLESNLIGLILMTTHVLGKMETSGGKIINIMSTAGQVGKVNEAIYCAAKWGARGYTEALKTTYKGTNIKVFGVYPGGMNTPFWASNVDKSKFMNPEEAASQIVFATCNGSSSYVTDIIIERA